MSVAERERITGELLTLSHFFDTCVDPNLINEKVKDYQQIQYRTKEEKDSQLKFADYLFAKEKGFFQEFTEKGGLIAFQAASQQYHELNKQILDLDEDGDAEKIAELDRLAEPFSHLIKDLKNLVVGNFVFVADIDRIKGALSLYGIDEINSFECLVKINAIMSIVVQNRQKSLADPGVIETEEKLQKSSRIYSTLKLKIEKEVVEVIKNLIQEFNKEMQLKQMPALLFIYESSDKNQFGFELNPNFAKFLQEKIKLKLQEQREVINALAILKEQCGFSGLKLDSKIRMKEYKIKNNDVGVRVVRVEVCKQKVCLLPMMTDEILVNVLAANVKEFKDNFAKYRKEKQLPGEPINLEFYAQISLISKYLLSRIEILNSQKDVALDIDISQQVESCKKMLEYVDNYKKEMKAKINVQYPSKMLGQIGSLAFLSSPSHKGKEEYCLTKEDMKEMEKMIGLNPEKTSSASSCIVS